MKLRRITQTATFIFLISLNIPDCLAESVLSWEKTDAKLDVRAGEKPAPLQFHFKVSSERAVQIKSLAASCNCLTATVDKRNFQPGETGTVKVEVTPGALRGVSEKQILVQLADEGAPSTLKVEIRIKEPIKVTPKILTWKQGERDEKFVDMTLDNDDRDLKITGIIVSESYEAKQAREINRISVRPKDSMAEAFGMLTIRTNYPKENPQSYNVQLRILSQPLSH